jgi:hypothetical protein
VRFAQAWPGIDVRYHGDGGQVEYDFLLAAGADPSRISMRLSGAHAMTISKSGDLLLHIPGGTLRQHAPVAFQGDARVPVSYALDGSDVRVRVGDYDRSRPLVIDPVVSFSSYLGGADSDQANGIAVDSTGAVIVAGDFYGGPTDVWLRKLAPGGSSVVWTTYVGGTGAESEGHVGVDGSNNVYVAGTTTSNDLPNRISGNTFKGGTTDAFVAKLPSSGASITWSKYIGSSGNDSGKAIAVDSSSVAVGGSSGGAVGNSFGTAGGTYAFAQRLDLNGATLGAFSVTGDGEDGGNAVGLSGTKVWLAGYTYALNSTPGFPVAGTPVQTGPATDGLGNYGYNGFVTLADTNGDPGALTCSTYFGSSDPQQDYVWGLAVGSDGNAHITGQLGNGSVSGVTFANSYAGGGDDAFVALLKNTCGYVSGSARFIGGSVFDRAWSIAVDSNNN